MDRVMEPWRERLLRHHGSKVSDQRQQVFVSVSMFVRSLSKRRMESLGFRVSVSRL